MDCVFCGIINGTTDSQTIYSDNDSIAFLDKHPLTPGHFQLVPKIHCRWIYELPHMGHIFTTAQNIIRVIIPVLGADHVTLGTFGHEIPHAHIWIVPQYQRHRHVSEGKGSRPTAHQQLYIAEKLRTALGDRS